MELIRTGSPLSFAFFLKPLRADMIHWEHQPDDVSSLNEPCAKLALYSTLAREAAA